MHKIPAPALQTSAQPKLMCVNSTPAHYSDHHAKEHALFLSGDIEYAEACLL